MSLVSATQQFSAAVAASVAGIIIVESDTKSLLNLFYERFITQITPEMEARISEQGLTLHQAVVLASIVEREAIIEEEMPKIAAVFINRLRGSINLGADPTVQYALGYNTTQGVWWTNPLSLDDLKLPSSNNTYENPGLPPGPICNPSAIALQAVANPVQSTYLYFRAAWSPLLLEMAVFPFLCGHPDPGPVQDPLPAGVALQNQ